MTFLRPSTCMSCACASFLSCLSPQMSFQVTTNPAASFRLYETTTMFPDRSMSPNLSAAWETSVQTGPQMRINGCCKTQDNDIDRNTRIDGDPTNSPEGMSSGL